MSKSPYVDSSRTTAFTTPTRIRPSGTDLASNAYILGSPFSASSFVINNTVIDLPSTYFSTDFPTLICQALNLDPGLLLGFQHSTCGYIPLNVAIKHLDKLPHRGLTTVLSPSDPAPSASTPAPVASPHRYIASPIVMHGTPSRQPYSTTSFSSPKPVAMATVPGHASPLPRVDMTGATPLRNAFASPLKSPFRPPVNSVIPEGVLPPADDTGNYPVSSLGHRLAEVAPRTPTASRTPNRHDDIPVVPSASKARVIGNGPAQAWTTAVVDSEEDPDLDDPEPHVASPMRNVGGFGVVEADFDEIFDRDSAYNPQDAPEEEFDAVAMMDDDDGDDMSRATPYNAYNGGRPGTAIPGSRAHINGYNSPDRYHTAEDAAEDAASFFVKRSPVPAHKTQSPLTTLSGHKATQTGATASGIAAGAGVGEEPFVVFTLSRRAVQACRSRCTTEDCRQCRAPRTTALLPLYRDLSQMAQVLRRAFPCLLCADMPVEDVVCMVGSADSGEAEELVYLREVIERACDASIVGWLDLDVEVEVEDAQGEDQGEEERFQFEGDDDDAYAPEEDVYGDYAADAEEAALYAQYLNTSRSETKATGSGAEEEDAYEDGDEGADADTDYAAAAEAYEQARRLVADRIRADYAADECDYAEAMQRFDAQRTADMDDEDHCDSSACVDMYGGSIEDATHAVAAFTSPSSLAALVESASLIALLVTPNHGAAYAEEAGLRSSYRYRTYAELLPAGARARTDAHAAATVECVGHAHDCALVAAFYGLSTLQHVEGVTFAAAEAHVACEVPQVGCAEEVATPVLVVLQDGECVLVAGVDEVFDVNDEEAEAGDVSACTNAAHQWVEGVLCQLVLQKVRTQRQRLEDTLRSLHEEGYGYSDDDADEHGEGEDAAHGGRSALYDDTSAEDALGEERRAADRSRQALLSSGEDAVEETEEDEVELQHLNYEDEEDDKPISFGTADKDVSPSGDSDEEEAYDRAFLRSLASEGLASAGEREGDDVGADVFAALLAALGHDKEGAAKKAEVDIESDVAAEQEAEQVEDAETPIVGDGELTLSEAFVAPAREVAVMRSAVRPIVLVPGETRKRVAPTTAPAAASADRGVVPNSPAALALEKAASTSSTSEAAEAAETPVDTAVDESAEPAAVPDYERLMRLFGVSAGDLADSPEKVLRDSVFLQDDAEDVASKSIFTEDTTASEPAAAPAPTAKAVPVTPSKRAVVRATQTPSRKTTATSTATAPASAGAAGECVVVLSPQGAEALVQLVERTDVARAALAVLPPLEALVRDVLRCKVVVESYEERVSRLQREREEELYAEDTEDVEDVEVQVEEDEEEESVFEYQRLENEEDIDAFDGSSDTAVVEEHAAEDAIDAEYDTDAQHTTQTPVGAVDVSSLEASTPEEEAMLAELLNLQNEILALEAELYDKYSQGEAAAAEMRGVRDSIDAVMGDVAATEARAAVAAGDDKGETEEAVEATPTPVSCADTDATAVEAEGETDAEVGESMNNVTISARHTLSLPTDDDMAPVEVEAVLLTDGSMLCEGVRVRGAGQSDVLMGESDRELLGVLRDAGESVRARLDTLGAVQDRVQAAHACVVEVGDSISAWEDEDVADSTDEENSAALVTVLKVGLGNAQEVDSQTVVRALRGVSALMSQNKDEVEALVRAQTEVDNVYSEWEKEREDRRNKAERAWALVQEMEARGAEEVEAMEREAEEEAAANNSASAVETTGADTVADDEKEEGMLTEAELSARESSNGLPPALLASLGQLCNTVCEGLVNAGLMQEEVAVAAGLLLERGDAGVVQAVLAFVDMNEAEGGEDAYVDALGGLVRALTVRVHAVANAFEQPEHKEENEAATEAEQIDVDTTTAPERVVTLAEAETANESASASTTDANALSSSSLSSDDVLLLLWLNEDPLSARELVDMHGVYSVLCEREGKEPMDIEQWGDVRKRAVMRMLSEERGEGDAE